jgi:ABC-type Zn2+ transport system substrate-binding protein/surface adhesin
MSTKTQILAIASTVVVLSLLAIGPILGSNSVFATSDNDNHDHHDNDRHHDCNRDNHDNDRRHDCNRNDNHDHGRD